MGENVIAPRSTMLGLVTTLLGLVTTGIGTYFLFLRAPLLPEDIRYTGIVFATWGGFIAGFGVVLLGAGIYFWSGRRHWLLFGIAAGVLIAFGRFLYSNVLLGSDFLWFIAVAAALALIVAVALIVQAIRRNRRP
jgi:hypothetical protein